MTTTLNREKGRALDGLVRPLRDRRRGLRYDFRVWPMRALTNAALIGAGFTIARFGEQLLDLS